MATLLIPTSPGVPYFTQKTRLDGRDFILKFSYNQREERYYLSIFDEQETPILMGLKLVAVWPLLRRYRANPALPPGELWVSDLTGNGEPPTLNELGEGKRCELTYVEAT